jgi:hypothetical protein
MARTTMVLIAAFISLERPAIFSAACCLAHSTALGSIRLKLIPLMVFEEASLARLDFLPPAPLAWPSDNTHENQWSAKSQRGYPNIRKFKYPANEYRDRWGLLAM